MEQGGRRIIFVEDDDLVRDIVEVLVEESPDHRIVARPATRAAALTAIRAVATGELSADTIILPDRLESDEIAGDGPLEIVAAIRLARLRLAVVSLSTSLFSALTLEASTELPRAGPLDIVPALDKLSGLPT